jgi:prophage regulatory protein
MINSNSKCDELQQNNDQLRKLIRMKAVTELAGISKSYVYSLSGKGLFPKSVQLVPGGSSVAWVEQEVLDWIDSRIKERDDSEAHS